MSFACSDMGGFWLDSNSPHCNFKFFSALCTKFVFSDACMPIAHPNCVHLFRLDMDMELGRVFLLACTQL